MSNKNVLLKIIFGFIIFFFSLALGYFTASYVREIDVFDYWGTLMIFAGLYILIGIVISQIFSISLGFLFSADVLILNVLLENFGGMKSIIKAGILGLILLILYIVSWIKFSDKSKDDALIESDRQPPSP